MNRDALMRRILWAAAAFNIVAALLLAFPGSVAGQVAGLPGQVPLPYRAMVALFVLLFAGAYAWLATRDPPDRPLVAFAAVGKTGVFLLVVALWLASEVSAPALLAASGDLAFVAAFVWWLRQAPVGGS